jgi:hypothetical protein
LEIKAVRDRHAALLRELRADQQQIKQTIAAPPLLKEFEAQAKPRSESKPSAQQRLDRLREGASPERQPPRAPNKDHDRER